MKKNENRKSYILIALVIITSIAFRKLRYLLYIIQIFFIIFGIKHLIKKTYKTFWFYRILYFIMIVLSIGWATSTSSVVSVLPSIVQIILLTLIMCGFIDDENKIDKIINIFVYSGIALLISILIFTPISEWKEIVNFSLNKYIDVSSSAGRLGPSIGMHSNGLGQTLVLCIMCTTYKYIDTKKFKFIFLNILLLIVMLFVKSRSSLIEAILGIFVVFIFSKKYPAKQIIYGFFCLILGALLIISCIKIPSLYKIVGYRLEGFVNIFENSNNVDSSTLTRMEFTKIGWDLFKSHPILGVGMNNFSYLSYNYYHTWAQVYSHNNFIEILSNLGIIGFYLYYYLYLQSFLRLIKLMKKFKNSNFSNLYSQAAFLFSCLIVLAIMNISHITYETECVQYMGMLIICGSILLNKKYNDVLDNSKGVIEHA